MVASPVKLDLRTYEVGLLSQAYNKLTRRMQAEEFRKDVEGWVTRQPPEIQGGFVKVEYFQSLDSCGSAINVVCTPEVMAAMKKDLHAIKTYKNNFDW